MAWLITCAQLRNRLKAIRQKQEIQKHTERSLYPYYRYFIAWLTLNSSICGWFLQPRVALIQNQSKNLKPKGSIHWLTKLTRCIFINVKLTLGTQWCGTYAGGGLIGSKPRTLNRSSSMSKIQQEKQMWGWHVVPGEKKETQYLAVHSGCSSQLCNNPDLCTWSKLTGVCPSSQNGLWVHCRINSND